MDRLEFVPGQCLTKQQSEVGIWRGRFLFIKHNMRFSMGDCGLTHVPVVTNTKFFNSKNHKIHHYTLKCGHSDA